MTKPTDSTDNLFAQPKPHLVDFAFDEQVARVFPDMIRRSVPGYETVIAMLGVFASRYVTDHSHVYDLGCSQGAATLALRRHIQATDVTIVAVDNAPAMIERCRANVAADLSPSAVDVRCADIQDVAIDQASLITLNYTLQFISIEQRLTLLQRIYSGLLPGGALVLAEKIQFAQQDQQQRFTDWHHEFKRLNGYSEMEISQKRQAIENVLIPEQPEIHEQRLRAAGFGIIECWFRCFNFCCWVAIK